MTGLTFENGLEEGALRMPRATSLLSMAAYRIKAAKLIHCESSEIIWNGLGSTTAKEL